MVAILLLLLISVWLLIQTDPVQNFLIGKVTTRLSKDLHTQISIRHVNINLFNRLTLQGTLIRDQQKDTILYANALKVRITDWFFLKKDIELKYISLEDALINAHRTNSVWNYQFLIDYFSGPTDSTTSKSGPHIDLKTFHLSNVHIAQIDRWVGQNIIVDVGELSLDANELNFNTKKVDISNLFVNSLTFHMEDYVGKRPEPSKKTTDSLVAWQKAHPIPKDPSGLTWNTAGWVMQLHDLHLNDCRFQSDHETPYRKLYSYFDPSHIDFNHINARFKDVRFVKDTISANIQLLSTIERSGFQVKKLNAQLRFHPKAMEFNEMDLITNKSHLRDYYAMRYNTFSDMSDFVTAVHLKANFKDSYVESDDIAYFAPELSSWKKKIEMSGKVEGAIDGLNGHEVVIKAGQNTSLTGDFSINGLPDIDQTFIDFRASDLRTTYTDAATFVPVLRNVNQPDLSKLGNIRFKGTFLGFIHDFVSFGTLQTSLGTVQSDLNMKFPTKGVASYKGKIKTTGFAFGKFLDIDSIGNVSFDATVDGSGFSLQTINAKLKGTISQFGMNGYNYHDIAVQGTFKNKIFDGSISANDPNLTFVLDGLVSFNKDAPEFNFNATIAKARFQALHLTNIDLGLQGKLALNFRGKNIDDFTGTARIYNATLTNGDEPLSFDSLSLVSQVVDNKKVLTLQSLPVTARIEGQYHILELPKIVQWYLSKYYPSYIKPIPEPTQQEDFTFNVETKDVEDYIPLIHPNIKGLDNSSVSGRISTISKLFSLEVDVPEITYKKTTFNDILIKGQGTDTAMKVEGTVGDIALNDSLHLPSTKLSITAANDISQISLQTSASQTLNAASLSARVQSMPDGINVTFDSSAIVINDKKWLIENKGEIEYRKNWVNMNNVRLTSGQESIDLSTHPSAIGSSNDILVHVNKVTIEDLLPLILKEPKLEGQLSGKVTIEDPFGKLGVDASDLTIEHFHFEGDSIGLIKLNSSYTSNGIIRYDIESDNLNNDFSIKGSYNTRDTLGNELNASIALRQASIKIIQSYLSSMFTDMNGIASDTLHIVGSLNSPQLIGKIHLQKASFRLLYTQCKYFIDDQDIEFKHNVEADRDSIVFGTIHLKDSLNNDATLTGSIAHRFFKDMYFGLRMNTDRFLVLNTTARDNKDFYGTAIARVTNARLEGPENDIQFHALSIEPVDSCHIYLPSGNSKVSALPDFIVFKVYGREMTNTDINRDKINFTVDLGFDITPLAKIDLILDETTGDVVKATGSGHLNIRAGSAVPMTMTGVYKIESGSYTFNFQTFFQKPFTIVSDDPSHPSQISWSGDPLLAQINIKAQYVATGVSLSNVVTTSTGTAINERTDVLITCELTNTLKKPEIKFSFSLPSDNPYKNDPVVAGYLGKITQDQGETTKQVFSLLIFNAFSTTTEGFANQVNSSTLVAGTVGQMIAGQLSSLLKTEIKKVLKDNTVDPYIIINPGFALPANSLNVITNASKFGFTKTYISGRLLVKAGVSLDYSNSPQFAQKSTNLLWSPDLSVEWRISPDGHLRLVGFNRTNYDLTYGRYNRTGVGLSYRKDFDRLIDLFQNDRKKAKREAADSSTQIK